MRGQIRCVAWTRLHQRCFKGNFRGTRLLVEMLLLMSIFLISIFLLLHLHQQQLLLSFISNFSKVYRKQEVPCMTTMVWTKPIVLGLVCITCNALWPIWKLRATMSWLLAEANWDKMKSAYWLMDRSSLTWGYILYSNHFRPWRGKLSLWATCKLEVHWKASKEDGSWAWSFDLWASLKSTRNHNIIQARSLEGISRKLN